MELVFWNRLSDQNYFVSNTGQIKSSRTHKEILAQTANGMAVVTIFKTGRSQNRRLDEIVASCFLEPGKEGQMLVHRNGDQMDCSENNLYWENITTHLRKHHGGTWKIVDD